MRRRIAVFAALFISFSGLTALAQFGGPDRSRYAPFPSMQGGDDSLPGSLEVTVRDANGQAAQNLRVELHDNFHGVIASGVTSGVGSFEFSNLPNGTYEVVAVRGADEARERIDFRGGTDDVILHLPAPAPGAAGNGETVSVAQMKVPPKAQRQLAKAKESLAHNKLAQARAEVGKALELYPEYGEAHAVLGLLDLSEGKASGAIGELEKAVRSDPNSVLNLAALGAAYNALHQYDNALRAAQSALRLAPNSWQAHLEMAKAYLGKNEFQEGLKSAEQALALGPPNYSQTHLLRAQALLGLKDYAEAVREYEQYLHRQPQGPEAAQVRQALDQIKTLAGNR